MRARLPLLLSMAVLLLLAVIAAHGGSAVPHGQGVLSLPNPPVVNLPSINHHTTRPANPVFTAGVPVGVIIVLLAVLAGVMILTGGRYLRRRRRPAGVPAAGDDEPDTEAAGESARALLQGARAALAELRQRTGGPPADAVQRAWLALEAAAADSGTTRRPEQTPTEFTTTLLADHRVNAAAVTTLLTRYQRARFGRPDTVTEADATAAATALDRIITDLAEAGERV